MDVTDAVVAVDRPDSEEDLISNFCMKQQAISTLWTFDSGIGQIRPNCDRARSDCKTVSDYKYVRLPRMLTDNSVLMFINTLIFLPILIVIFIPVMLLFKRFNHVFLKLYIFFSLS